MAKIHSKRDSNAVHIDTAGEISGITEKASPVSGDLIIIEDSAAGNVKKKVQIGNLNSGDADAIHDNVAGEIVAITEKTSLVGNDEFLMEDSADSNNKKSIKASNLDLSVMKNTTSAFITTTGVTYENLSANGDIGSTANTVCAGNDARLSDNRTDANAIHDNVAAEINAITEKASPVSGDLIIIEDSEASNAKKKVQIGNLPTGTDSDAIHDNVAAEISAITEKASPVGADLILIEDSEASNAKKKVQISNLPTGSDADAIHDNVAGEIVAITEKESLAANDEFIIEDSADSNNKKSIKASTLDLSVMNNTTSAFVTGTKGIANDNIVEIDSADVADNDYAKFTANGLEGRSYSEVKTDLSLNNVENTTLSTWAGSANINTVGTIGSGTWQGSVVDHERGGLEADVSAYAGLVHITGGTTSAKTIGIAENNIVGMDDSDAADNDYAKFTANGLEGRSYSEVKTDLSLNSVENTALSTWAGTSNITTVGTISSGTWQGTDIAATYLADTAVTPGSYTNASITVDQQGRLTAASSGSASNAVRIGVACSDETSNLTEGTSKVTFRTPCAITLSEVRANVNTAPTGSTIIVDINEDGSTILSTKLTIDASEKTSTTAETAAVISDSSLADDAEITVDIDQIGSTVAGKGLKIWLIGTVT